MPLSLDEYRIKLINKIVLTGSPEDVKRFINAAMKALQQNNVNGYIVARFVDKVAYGLEQLDNGKKDSLQWSNIQTGKIYLNSIKQQISTTTN